MSTEFVAHDLPPTFLKDPDTAIQDFEVAIRDHAAGIRAQFAARAAFDAAMDGGWRLPGVAAACASSRSSRRRP